MLTTCIIITIVLVLVTKHKLEGNRKSIGNCWKQRVSLMEEKYAIFEILAGFLKSVSVDYFEACNDLIDLKDRILRDKLKSRMLDMDKRFDDELDKLTARASKDPDVKDVPDFAEICKDISSLQTRIHSVSINLNDSMKAYNAIFENKVTAFIATKLGHSECSLDKY